MLLPNQISLQEFQATIYPYPERWLPEVADICAAHHLPITDIRPFSEGSNLVASVDGRYVVKIFPPFHRHQWHSEHLALGYLGNRLTVPVPNLLAAGQRGNDWSYVVLSQLQGTILEEIWPALTLGEKEDLLGQIGQLMAEVHGLAGVPLPDLEPTWAAFLPRQQANAAARHRRLGAPDWLLEGLDDFVQESAALLPPHPEIVLLTGEYTPFNLLVEQRSGRWVLSGMIDFGDAMPGPREYDLLGPSVFMGEGNAGLLRSLFQGYGWKDPDVDVFRRRLMLLLLLHRYSNLNLQIRIPAWQSRVHTIAGLSQLIWPNELF